MRKQRFIIFAVAILLTSLAIIFWRLHKKITFDLKQLASKEKLVPIAIIGSGPAGLSAALYGARLGFDTVVFEGPKPGGQLTETGFVENWPGVGRKSGPAIMKDERSYVKELGALVIPETIRKVDFSTWPYHLITEENETINALTVIIATGSAPRVLAIEGEREYWGKGVTTCAICDAPYYKNKEVVVIGGGDSAAEEAMQLAPYAKKITILVRKDKMRASEVMFKRLQDFPNISVIYHKELRKIYGDGHWVEGGVAYDNETKSTVNMPFAGIFLAIGHEPRTTLFKGQLKLDKQGYVKLKNRSQQTSKVGVFAAGDVEDAVYRQAGVAAGSGIKSAIEVSHFLQKIGWTPLVAYSMSSRIYEQEQIGLSRVSELTSEKEFEEKVLRATKPAIIDFYALHCPSCMHMLPVYEAVARKFYGDIHFFKVNTTQVPTLDERLKVQRIPCFIVFKDGQQVARYYSIMNKPQMVEFVQQFV